MNWKITSLLLCLFGVLKEFRLLEPYFADYLTSEWKNFTETEVYQDIYPVATYANLATLLPVLLLTDILRYKPIIILCGLSLSCAYIIMVFTQTLWEMNIEQFLYGLFCSTEVAYFAYIYAKVDKEHYQAVSSHTRVALLVGRFCSSVIAQIIVSFELMNYNQLVYVTTFGAVVATIWAFFLPSVNQSVYFHRKTDSDCNDRTNQNEIQISTIELEHNTVQSNNSHNDVEIVDNSELLSMRMKIIKAYRLLWKDFLLAYSNWYVFKWSLWWIFATGAFLQFLNYIQVLWQEISGKEKSLYNGAIEASYTILGALAALAVGQLRLDWSKIGEAMLAIFSIIQGIFILLASKTDNIWISYAVYIGLGVLYQAMITITSAEVAKNLPEDSYGLIFGTNTLISLLLQSALTFTVIGNQGFALTVRYQYVVYGGFFIILGALFTVITVYTGSKNCWSQRKTKHMKQNQINK